MFVIVICFTLVVIALTALKDWIRYPYLFRRATLKKIQGVNQLIALEQFQQAQIELQPLLKKRKCKESMLCHIRVLRGTNQLEEALVLTQKCARIYPEELLFRLEEAMILLMLGNIIEALESFKICAPILREEKELYLFALTYFKNNQFDECAQILEPLLMHSRDDQLFILAADCKVQQRHFGQAIELYNAAISIKGESHALYTKLADAYRRHGNLSQSEKMFREILEKDEGDTEAIIGWGACMIERGLLQKALLFFQSSKAWRAGDLRLYLQAAQLAIKLKKYEEAEALFAHLLKQGENSAQTLIYYGYCLENLQRWQEAEHIYRTLISKYPKNPQGFRALSWMFGVGLTTGLSTKEGVAIAYHALSMLPDALSWEIVSAAEARAENFVRAYEILASLIEEGAEPAIQLKRQRALRNLRKNLPLDDNMVLRAKVA